MRWMSPELIDPERFGLEDSRPTKESDCYAFGMVIYEVLSGRLPFASFIDMRVFLVVLRGERPERPDGPKGAWFTDGLWRMLNLCWEAKRDNRPKIEDILVCLEQVSKNWKPPIPQAHEDLEMDEDDLEMDEDDLETDEDDSDSTGVSDFLRSGPFVRLVENPVLIASPIKIHSTESSTEDPPRLVIVMEGSPEFPPFDSVR